MAQKDLMHLARNPKTAKTICTCFRQYDSWGIELDCIKVFSGNWEAISQKLLVILCVNVIATVQVPLTGSHSPSSCSLHSFCQDKIWHLYTPVSIGILAPPPSPPPPDTQHLLDIVTLLAFILGTEFLEVTLFGYPN